MNYYSISNPLGSILFFANAYNQSDISSRKKLLFEWFKHQFSAISIEQCNIIYANFELTFNLDADILDNLFQKLGWQTFYVLPLLKEKIKIAEKSGLIKKQDDKFTLTKLGASLFENDEYNEYINSIHYKANFWKNNNVIITDNTDRGSGFFIDEKTIVTCRHVYDDLDSAKIIFQDESKKIYTVSSVKYHPNNKIDLVKITVNEKYEHFTYEIEEKILLTERVIVFGYPPIPLASEPFLVANLGEVSSIVDNYLDGTDCVILSCILRPGNSGGAIVNEYGKLIAVSTQNRSHKFNPSWNDMADFDFNKGLGYSTGLCAKYLQEF